MSTTVLTASDTGTFNDAIAYADAAVAGTTVEIDLTTNIIANAQLVPLTIAPGATVIINGEGHTLSGGFTYRGLFVYSGAVTIENLEISDTVAKGGDGDDDIHPVLDSGGGGAGLGGGLFVADDVANGAAAPGSVTLVNVGFDHDEADGGSAAAYSGLAGYAFGGGGMAGNSSNNGIENGGAGIGPNNFGHGGASEFFGRSGKGGGFGGGGGGANNSDTFPETNGAGGAGGYGGGGGAGNMQNGAAGFGAGAAVTAIDGTGQGGGGLGAGGDVFIEQGASLSITGGTMSNGVVRGGTGGTNGQAWGAGIFMQGAGAVHFGAGSIAGQVTTIDAVIADESGASGQNAGASTVFIDGAGTVVLSATNAFTNSAVLETQATTGTLDLKAINAVPSAVSFRGPATLRIENAALAGPGVTFGATITGFGYADVIDLPGLAYSTGAQVQYSTNTHTLVVSNGQGISDIISDLFSPALPSFSVMRDATGGTEVVEAFTRTADDFSQSGTSDILFRDDNSGDRGDTGLYVMSKGVFQHWDDIGPSSTAYAIVGTGDFRGNGGQNVLYEDLTHGDVGYYQISAAGSNLGWTDIGAASTAYSIVGTGDFFGTGQDEILFRNNTGVGDTGFYALTPSGTLAGWHDIGPSSTAYSIVGVGDFNGDRTSDVLYRSASTGDTGFYQVNNGHLTSWSDIGVTSTAYSVVGVGDFLGKGTEEALFRSNASGDTGFYTAGSTWHDLGASSTAYQVVGIGNYAGDATSDILFRASGGTGDTGFYQIENGAITTWHDVGATSTLYTVHT